jgi:ubiquitin carboxyl-terminal hydrolase 8
MDYQNNEDKGLSGLTNLGNTCFINSCVAVLSHTHELNEIINDEKTKKRIKNKLESALLIEWNSLRQLLWTENCVVSPNKFIKTIQHVAKAKDMSLFTGYSQNDLPEFLLFLIDCFHSSISREIKVNISGEVDNSTDAVAVKCFEMVKNMYTKDYSEIWNLFYAIHVSEISSLVTGEQFLITPEPYFMIDLPIPQNNKSPSLIDCFDLYVEGETLEGENAWYNEKTKQKVNIKKQIRFWSFPNILVIDFKRFNYRNQKNQILIDFPLNKLDLSKYVIGYKKHSYKYELYGVCNHSGGVLGGHYTSYVKTINNKWYHVNDTNVTHIKEPKSIITPQAYCLFYRKSE